MHKKLVMLCLFVLFVAASVSAQEMVRCESNDGRYRECAIDGAGRLVLTRQLSDTNCVEGRNWGFRDGRIWVDAGCRGEFAFSQANIPITSGKLVVCESENNTRSDCRTETSGGVAVARQLSRNACVRGKSWGYDGNSIWVDDGCRAEFIVGTGNTDRTFERLDQVVLCESLNGKPARCLADTSAGVHLVQTRSDSNCRFGRQWGYDENGIWVREGCRAEFAVRGPMQAQVIQTTTPAPVVIERTTPVIVERTTPVYIATSDRIPGTLRCESDNMGRKHCRTDTRYGLTLVRQLSDNMCVRDRTWGVDKDGVWVDDGCRADFTIGHEAPLVAMTSGVTAPPTMLCESIDGNRTNCAVDTSMGVRLYRQVSDSDCLLNSTWGYDANGIWVSGGCRAEFALGEGRTVITTTGVPQAGRVLCESKDGKRALCAADTRAGVAVVRQVSDKPCILNSTWGYDTDGIWVTAGCRAEFILRR